MKALKRQDSGARKSLSDFFCEYIIYRFEETAMVLAFEMYQGSVKAKCTSQEAIVEIAQTENEEITQTEIEDEVQTEETMF